MWTHLAGEPVELEIVEKIISDFDASQDEYVVKHEAFPQGAYNDSVAAAAVAGDLPCILDMDGPIVPNWAWAGYITPLELSQDKVDALLPSATGVYQDQLYSVGYWDDALAMFARKSVLDEHGIRIPTVEEPWTGAEFDDALVTLKESGDFKYALDLATGWTGEWWPYAFSPFLQSFGGDLIDRDTYTSAEGALNGPEAVEFGTWFQSLFTRDLVNPQGSQGREEFLEGTVALSWNGNWEAPKAIEAFGDDVLFLPPPDFGEGPVIGRASWQWGVSSTCEGKDGAMEYLEFSLKPEYIAAFSDRGHIPSTDQAAALTENYKQGGRLSEFVDYSKQYAVIRPPTPAYPVIASVFEKHLTDIMNGADVNDSLDGAVEEIDANIESNDGYGF